MRQSIKSSIDIFGGFYLLEITKEQPGLVTLMK